MILALQGLLPWIFERLNPTPVFSFILVVLAIFLWRKSWFAFHAFRFLMWLTFLIALLVGLGSVFAWQVLSSWSDMTYTGSQALTIAWHVFWLFASGALLYYSETDKVRLEYNLPAKKSGKSSTTDSELIV